MQDYTLICPITHDPMFFKEGNEAYTKEEWAELEVRKIAMMASYEVFFSSEDRQKELLDLIEASDRCDEEEKKTLSLILEPVADKDYQEIWKTAGELKPRILLYPGGHERNRIRENDDNKDFSELAYLLMYLRSMDIHFTLNDDVTIDVSSSAGGRIAVLKPCCPKCHTILPDKWFNSVGYYKIGVLAPPVGGKTTLLSSWMINDYEAIRTMSFANRCSAVYGLKNADVEFEIQKYFREAAEKLYKNGDYPGRDEQTRKPPVYTRVIHYTDEINPKTKQNEEYLLVGSYDVAGETLQELLKGESNQELVNYLEHMDAFIYLISPSQLHGLSKSFSDKKKTVPKAEKKKLIVLKTPGEQGLYQKAHAGETVCAPSLFGMEEESDKPYEAWEIFHKIDSILIGESLKSRMHMAYTLVKGDELKGLPEVMKAADPEILFSETSSKDMADASRRAFAMNEAKKIISRFAVKGSEQKRQDFMDYLSETDKNKGGFHSVSWHLVSAGKKAGPGGDFESFRRIDPLMGCLDSVFRDLGWHEG